MKILIFGLGSVGQRHLQNITKLYKKSVIGTASNIINRNIINLDRSKSNKKITDKFKIKILKSRQDIIKFKPSHVIISNENQLHYKTIIKFMKMNVNIFVEKPLVIKVPELNKLKTNLLNSVSVLNVGYQLRFHPCIKLVKKFLLKNKFELIQSSFSCLTYLPEHRPWQNYKKSYASLEKKGGGVINNMSHEIDLINYFFGKPKSVIAINNKKSIKIEAEENTQTILKYKKNFSVSLNLSFASKVEKRDFTILSNNFLIECNLLNNNVFIHMFKTNKTLKYKFNFKRNDMFIDEIKNFFYLCKNKNKNNIDNNGFETTEIMFGIKKSLKSDKEIFLT